VIALNLVVFEDNYFSNFLPLTYSRPVFELRVGMLTLLDRLLRVLDFKSAFLITRSYLSKIESERREGFNVNSLDKLDDEVLIVNGRLIANENSKVFLEHLIRGKSRVALSGDGSSVVAAKLNRDEALEVLSDSSSRLISVDCFLKLKHRVEFDKASNVDMLCFPWDLLECNSTLMHLDFNLIVDAPGLRGYVDDSVVIYGSTNKIYIAENAEVEGHVIIDARGGPVFIGDEVKVQGPTRIEGPCYIGRKTRILSGARIRSGSSIGETCRVGGEVEESIFHGYVNMYHVGFIGHSYVGEWVNLGALTVNSDLKNTYGVVKVRIANKMRDTGKMKVGCFIADHVKTAIGCQIWTGKTIGLASHLYGVIFEDVPSFTIYAKSIGLGAVELYLDSALKTMFRVYSRRGKTPSEAEVELMKTIFKLTESERRAAGVVKGRLTIP